MLILLTIPKWVNNIIYMFLLLLDSVVYFFVSIIYQLFIYLSTARIFEDSFFANFSNRIYAILGVFMLFYLAYSLLIAIVDPERLTKGDKSVAKLAQNLVISLVILGFLPSIFAYSYRLQNYVLSSNIIGALVLGAPVVDPNETNETSEAMIKFGDNLSFLVLNSFINPTNVNANMGDNYNWFDFKNSVLLNSDYHMLPGLAEGIAYGAEDVGNEAAGDDQVITYYPVISTATGIYLIYILLSFTLDLGVRIIKLAFCQLIAPIPIIMRAMPGKKGTFDKWLKLTLTVYFEVFVRVAIMYISVYFIQQMSANQTITNFIGNGVMGMLALVVVVLGIFSFAKQAPKLISETLGIDSGNIKLGIGDKLKASGFLGNAIYGAGQKTLGAVTGALGGGVSGLANGAGGAGFLFGAANGWKNKGMQFSNQRQALYSKLSGDMKGKAGWFGGQSVGTKVSNAMTDYAPNIAADRRAAEMAAYEAPIIAAQRAQYEESQRQARERMDTLKKQFEEQKELELEELNGLTEEKTRIFDQEQEEKIRRIEDKYRIEREEFERNKQQRLQDLKLQKIRAENNHDVAEMARINREIASEESSKYDNLKMMAEISAERGKTFAQTMEGQELLNQINSVKNRQFQPDEEYNELSRLVNTEFDAKSASAALQKEYRENEGLAVDAASKKYRAHAQTAYRLGETKATNQQKEAFEKVLKELGYDKDKGKK